MFRDATEMAELSLDEQLEIIEESALTRRVLSAVETYKEACRVAGEEPTEEDAWLVLLSALQLEERV